MRASQRSTAPATPAPRGISRECPSEGCFIPNPTPAASGQSPVATLARSRPGVRIGLPGSFSFSLERKQLARWFRLLDANALGRSRPLVVISYGRLDEK